MRDKRLKKLAFPTLPLAVPGNPGLAGRWGKPLIVEIGAGKGYFAIHLATLYPNATILALDVKAPRLWYGAMRAQSLNLTNVRFVCQDAALLEQLFAPGEVDKIWLTFPDPYPKKRHARRRLTTTTFLEIYRRILRPDGEVHLKTDNPGLFEFTLEMLRLEGVVPFAQTDDLHRSPWLNEETGFATPYEETFLAQGLKIFYLAFRF
ncbi:MAG: tRNA (guanosine(46)-N7)-methyltransferase TrmB [Bacteroidia bacterium]|nr:tRNA (guanosine(46)-N7)-methyltransferase TrmB [Bacteroidia bacterium]